MIRRLLLGVSALAIATAAHAQQINTSPVGSQGVTPAGALAPTSLAQIAGRKVYVDDWYAVADDVQSSTGSVSGTAFSDSNANFTAADAALDRNGNHKLIYIQGAGAGGAVLADTIVGFTDNHDITLGSAAPTAISNTTYEYGTDNHTAFSTALAAAAAYAGGSLCLATSGGYLDSAQETIPYGVTFGCNSYPEVFKTQIWDTTEQRPLFISGYVGGSIGDATFQQAGKVQGVTIAKAGVNRYSPTLAAAGILINHAAYAGTAIAIGNGSNGNSYGATVRETNIFGFNQAIYTNQNTDNTFDTLRMDDTNCISINNNHDWTSWHNLQCSPLLQVGFGSNIVSTTITAMASYNAGTQTQITYASNALGIPAGATVPIVINSATGITSLNNQRFTATYLDATDAILNVAWPGGSYTGSGTATLISTDLMGTGYKIANSESPSATDIFALGQDVALDFNTNARDGFFTNFAADDNDCSYPEQQKVGINVGTGSYQNTVRLEFLGCKTQLITMNSALQNVFSLQIVGGKMSTINGVATAAIPAINVLAGKLELDGVNWVNNIVNLAAGAYFLTSGGEGWGTTFVSGSDLSHYYNAGNVFGTQSDGTQLAGPAVTAYTTNSAGTAQKLAWRVTGGATATEVHYMPYYFNSGLGLTTRVVTAAGAVTVTNADIVVEVNKTTGAATTVNLPIGVLGQRFVIKDGKGDAATNNITVTPAAGNIDGSATYVISTAYGFWAGEWDGAKWITDAQH